MKRLEYIEVNVHSRKPKYKQVMDSIIKSINQGKLVMGERIPSINEVSEGYLLSRDTVEKAYSLLKEQNIIISVKGKGYYIAKTDLSIKANVLFLSNKLSTYKMEIFNSFVTALGTNANVDLDIYHCDANVLNTILEKKKNQYDYLVLMPHFKNENSQHVGCPDDVLKTIHTIPEEKLIIMDRNLDSLSTNVGRIYQDFVEDIHYALTQGLEKIKKYKKIILVYPTNIVYPYPEGIMVGFKRFCIQNTFDYEILNTIYDGMELQSSDLYVVVEEVDLVNLVKQARDIDYKLGQDIGIISYNDTLLKELLGITVISTNFTKMGFEAAQMILNKHRKTIKNEFNFIDRHSV